MELGVIILIISSGTVVVTGIDEGLYILNPTFDDTAPDAPANISYAIPQDGTISFNWTLNEDIILKLEFIDQKKLYLRLLLII